ncbi:MAG: carboxypeptidase-like regulatory domain-containing protein [Armatimonadota bacterium]|nr:carboxypeptidase-like regulatory domain-containing protein [Armatimonadota bacterium]MDR7533344.1 carboxypeptidase-like regulatory domain-containing protein [Armatimonadota bacterium]MDR7536464.1 carboxypeptidase-like regulatory domain-containing protein [Armatimonadota bacterium]
MRRAARRAPLAAALVALWLPAIFASAVPAAGALPSGSSPAPEASAGAIAGVVRNGTTGRSAAGQAVLLVSVGPIGSRDVGRVRTDGAGRFAFRGLADGRYLVQTSHAGVVYAAHVVVAGGPVRVELLVYDVASGVPLRVALVGMVVEVHAGYVRVFEVWHLRNTTVRTYRGDVGIPLPQGARYVRYHAGFHQPRVERGEIRDRIVVRPGADQLSFSYAVAGAGAAVLDRPLRLPVDRAVVFAGAPAEIRSPQFQPAPPLESEGRRYARAWARALRPGDLVLTVAGVPPVRRWPAPTAAGTLAGLLAVGLAWTLWRRI